MNKSDNNVISDKFLEKYRNRQPKWGFGDLSYITYKRSYAREIEGENRTEEFCETLQRVINGAQKIGADYTKEEAERFFKYCWNLKCSLSGRMLWQLGTTAIDRLGMNSLLSCWFVIMDNIDAQLFLFENLMLGGGVGFSVKRESIYEYPKIKSGVSIQIKNEKDADFIVPDSREGWIKLLNNVLKSYFYTGESFTYSTILIRGYGEKIKTFGGTASGAGILIEGITDICKIFDKRIGKKLRSIDVLDINNIIGKIVVSGNVRRSAEIALGDVDDSLFLQAKRWDKGNIPNWRAMSNNSIYCNDIEHLNELFWDGYLGNGEPYGLVNMKLSKTYGRLKDKMKDNCEGTNPCAEILLSNWECCNLSEIFLNNVDSKEELFDIIKLLYKTQKAICNGKYLWKKTEEVVHKNNRIGISITGICQSILKLEWLNDAYDEIRKYDKEYSKLKNWNESIRLTTVKPSGTLSLLSGSSSGIHPAYSEYYYRTVRLSSSDNLVKLCRDLGYKMDYQENFDGTIDRNIMVIYFPIHVRGAIYAKDMTSIQQLELVKRLQTEWSDNSVSVTIYYKKEELPEIKEWLKKNYKDSVKTISFLLHSEHGFKQAVLQEIDKEEYEKSIKSLKKIEFKENDFGKIKDLQDCDNGSCGLNDILVS